MNFLSQKAQELTPYVPGEQPKGDTYIKLNTNENPYPPSPKAIEAIKKIDAGRLRLYPDPESTRLREVYARYLGVKAENIFVGNGSDEVLAIAFQAFFMDKENILMPDIAYSFYPVYCNLYRVSAKEIPLKDDYTIEVSDYLQENNGLIITNPNAPTGMAISLDAVKEIVSRNANRVVLIDEAYVDFGAESAVQLIAQYDNLLVVRTLSKSHALAGLRVGFAVGNEELIAGMNRVKNSVNSYPIDTLAQIGAEEAIKDVEHLMTTTNTIIQTRSRVSTQLKALGFTVLESASNFLFITHQTKYAADIFAYLKENKILVRYFDKPRLDNALRVSIGTDEEMDQLIDCIARFVR